MGFLVLGLSALAYAVGIVAQTVAARKLAHRDRLELGLLARLATDRVYLVGFTAQVAGFGLAFLARATLPLYLVQAGASSAVGIAAVLGAVVLGWRIRWASWPWPGQRNHLWPGRCRSASGSALWSCSAW
jgi:hypothetical protein